MKVTIIGGGISGLTLAWYLQKQGHTITLYEKSDRLGGWIRTIEKDGFLFELGPRSCRPHETTLTLAKEVGLEEEIIWASEEAKKRYILNDGRLQTVRPFKLLPQLLRERLRRPRHTEDESVASFFGHRFSPDFVSSYVDPMVSGIYAGDPDKLSMQSCFPNIHAQGCVVKTFKKQTHGLFSFQRGMESLPQAIANRLDIDIQLNTPVDPNEIDADKVFVTAPTLDTPRASVAIVNLGYHRPVLDKTGFGYLIPSSEGEKVLGVVMDSVVFPTQGSGTRLTVMIGGTRAPHLVNLPPKHLAELALDTLQRHLGIERAPDTVHTSVARNAIPQYPVGHQERLADLPYIATGAAYNGVSINDCIANAKEIASSFQYANN